MCINRKNGEHQRNIELKRCKKLCVNKTSFYPVQMALNMGRNQVQFLFYFLGGNKRKNVFQDFVDSVTIPI